MQLGPVSCALFAALAAFALAEIAEPASRTEQINFAPIVFTIPSTFHPAPGSNIKVVLHDAGDPSAEFPWPSTPVRRILVRGAGRQENRETLTADAADASAGVTPVLPPGGVLIGIDLQTRTGTVDAAEFTRLVPQPITSASRAAERKTGTLRIQYESSGKAIVRCGADATGSEAVCSKAGLRCEIQPLSDPSQIPIGSDLPARVLIEGSAAKDVHVLVAPPDNAAALDLVTDAAGLVHIPINAGGIWKIHFQHARTPRAESKIDCELFTGTLIFSNSGAENVK